MTGNYRVIHNNQKKEVMKLLNNLERAVAFSFVGEAVTLEPVEIRTHRNALGIPKLVVALDILAVVHQESPTVVDSQAVVRIAALVDKVGYHEAVIHTVAIGCHHTWKLQVSIALPHWLKEVVDYRIAAVLVD